MPESPMLQEALTPDRLAREIAPELVKLLQGDEALRQALVMNLAKAITPGIITMLRLPEILEAKEAAQLHGVSLATWYNLNARGLVPAPVELGGSDRLQRWSRQELIEYFNSGVKTRREWEEHKRRAARGSHRTRQKDGD